MLKRNDTYNENSPSSDRIVYADLFHESYEDSQALRRNVRFGYGKGHRKVFICTLSEFRMMFRPAYGIDLY